MKIKSSLKSIKKRDLNSKLVRREVEFMSLIKQTLNLKQDEIIFMDNENHKKTWRIYKFVLGTVAISILVLMALFLL